MIEDWVSGEAAKMATSLMSSMGDRWAHVQAAGATAESLAKSGGRVPDLVVAAAWLHDIGYAPGVRSTGFHPLDGARFLAGQAAPSQLVSLVAYHTGAAFEAEERGLTDGLGRFARPNERDLDLLTFVDLTTGPTGQRVNVRERLDEIIERYSEDDPVYRAVKRSRSSLIESCERAVAVLGLSNEWLFAPV